MSTLALQVRGLTRRYGARIAVRFLDLSVQEGDVYGFLGPNGAGKTTAMRCILGLIRSDTGTVEIFGQKGRAARREVGALVETPAFHEWATGRDNLRYSAAYAGISPFTAEAEIDRVLDRVGLTERAADKAGGYSLGMRQRLAIGRALLGRPRLLLLDEPTNGLDPAGMREMRDLVRSLALHDKITVFLSSHLLAEVQAICNRVGILDEGTLKAEGDVAELLRGDGSPVRVVEVGAPVDQLKAAVTAWSEVEVEGPGAEGRTRLRLRGLEPAALNKRLIQAGVDVDALIPERRNLEDVFIEVTTGVSPMNAGSIPTIFGAVLWAETRKILSRPIARVGLVLLALAGAVGPLAMFLVLHTGVQVNGGDVASNFDPCAANTIGWSLHVRNFFVIHVLLTVLAALTYAGELQSHALREDLVRPVPRSVVLLAKWGALGAWALAGLVGQLAVATVFGIALQPLHGEATWGHVALGYLESWISEVGFAALALAAAVLVRSVAGTLLAVFLFLVFEQGAAWALSLMAQFISALPPETQLGVLPQVVKILPFLPSSAWAVWTEGLTGAGPSWQGWVGLGVYTVAALVAADRLFARTDVP